MNIELICCRKPDPRVFHFLKRIGLMPSSYQKLASPLRLSGSRQTSIQSSLQHPVSGVPVVKSREFLWLTWLVYVCLWGVHTPWWWNGLSTAMGKQMCVLYQVATRLTDVPGKTYDVGVTNIEDLTPGSSTFSKIAKFYPCRGLNSFPHVQELGALTKELASPLWLAVSFHHQPPVWTCTVYAFPPTYNFCKCRSADCPAFSQSGIGMAKNADAGTSPIPE
jgi:hypothetical protein